MCATMHRRYGRLMFDGVCEHARHGHQTLREKCGKADQCNERDQRADPAIHRGSIPTQAIMGNAAKPLAYVGETPTVPTIACGWGKCQHPLPPRNPYVFAGHIHGRPLVNVAKPWRRIRELAGLPDMRRCWSWTTGRVPREDAAPRLGDDAITLRRRTAGGA
jgi:hypothetical protein